MKQHYHPLKLIMKFVILLLLCFVVVSAQQISSNKYLNYSSSFTETPAGDDARGKLLKLETNLKSIVRSLLKMAMPTVLENVGKLNLSSECMRNSFQFVDGLWNLKPWALSLVDSSGKSFDGLLSGTVSALGVFDQCLDTVATSSRNTGRQLFRGQYCIVKFRPNLFTPKRTYLLNDAVEGLSDLIGTDSIAGRIAADLHVTSYAYMNIGVCVPSGCKIEDITQIAAILGSMVDIETKVEYCQVREKTKFSVSFIALMCISVVLVFLVIVASFVDDYSRRNKIAFKSTYIRMLLAFSCLKNFERFSSADTQENFRCLHRVRTLSLLWVIFGQTYLILNYNLLQSSLNAKAFVRNFAFQVVVNGTVAADSFFFMGGMLLSYWTVYHVQERKKPFNVIHYMVYRLWRIVPSFYFIYCIILVHPVVTSGPLYLQTNERFLEGCKKYWWPPFLFISNLYDVKNMCAPHTWYLAADMQLYIASLVILIPLLKWPKLGITLAFVSILSSVVCIGVVTYVNNLPAAILPTPDTEFVRNQFSFYIKPYSHLAPYALGIIIGYFLLKKNSLKMPLIIQVVGWCLSVTLTSVAVFTTQKWNSGVPASALENVFFACTYRLAFSLGLAWVVVCCITGHGGIVNYLLSLRIWIHMGRLSFLVYLIHPMLALEYMAGIKTLIQADNLVMVWLFFGYLVASYLLAFILHMIIEAPFTNLQKMAFKREQSKISNETISNLKEISSQKSCEKHQVTSCNNTELVDYNKDKSKANNV